MDCATVKPKMEALASGTLPDSEREIAELHIATCEGCRLELELVRAIGAQEAASEPGQADWSLDRIFGGGTGATAEPPPGLGLSASESPDEPAREEAEGFFFGDESAGAEEPASPAGAEEPEPPLSADGTGVGVPHAVGEIGSPLPHDASDQDKTLDSWGFESADAKPEVSPPEKSLFFAEEALTRRRNIERKKSSMLRLILGVTGGVVGAVLLAVSAWIAFHMAQPSADSDDVAAPARRPPKAVPPVAQTQDSAAATDAASVGGGSEAQDSPAESPGPPAPETAGPLTASSSGQPSPLPVPATSPKPSKTAAASRPSARPSPAPSAELEPPRIAPQKTAPQTSVSASEMPNSGDAHETALSRTVGSIDSPASASRVGEEATQARPAPRVAEEATTHPAPEPVPGPSHASEGAASPSGATAPSAAPAPSAAAAPSPARLHEPAPSPETSAAPAKPHSGGDAAPQPAEVTTPIERLHLATAAAEQQGDLAALRRLRVSWKGYISKMGVGPDRARAKREYADCLWAIQSLTGRRADQKDALAAYREYILSSSAGGADSRSVSRLRQLEDALSEQR